MSLLHMALCEIARPEVLKKGRSYLVYFSHPETGIADMIIEFGLWVRANPIEAAIIRHEINSYFLRYPE